MESSKPNSSRRKGKGRSGMSRRTFIKLAGLAGAAVAASRIFSYPALSSAVFSPKRRVALEMIEEFVEDFKASAPIWKYDLINGERVYAKDRSTAIEGSGLLKVNK